MLRFRRCPDLVLTAPGGEPLEVVQARGPIARLLGLALIARPPRRALLIPRCRSVHTWGMRFAIDVVFVAPAPGGLEVVSVHPSLPPRRLASLRAGREVDVLELPAGLAAHLSVRPGCRLRQSTTGATAAGAGRTNTRWPTS